MSQPKVALVTGANRGIGYEVAKQLSETGFQVIVTARDFLKAEHVAKQIGKDTFPIQLDVSSDESCEAFAAHLKNQLDTIDVLVNNAGLMGSQSLMNFDLKEIKNVMNVNFMGPIRVTQHLLPFLKKSNEARIINVSSGMGSEAEIQTGGYAAYRFSKYAMNAFTKMLNAEATDNLKVFSVCPGWCQTDMGGGNAPRTAAKGAETISWIASSKDVKSGKFYRDKEIIDW